MWRDEVRAFSVATNAPSWLELFYSLHQEGHPIVWYAVLRLGYALTHSTLVLSIAALIVAWGAAFLMLRFAPFPFWIRLLAVFGAFLGYEMSVVSRNYGSWCSADAFGLRRFSGPTRSTDRSRTRPCRPC